MPRRDSKLPAPVSDALRMWLDEHERVVPGLIEGLYVVGSVALDDWRPGSDIDIVATTADVSSDADAVLLQSAAEHVRDALGGSVTIDGPIVPWSDLSSPPLAALRPWTLDGEFHYDGDCFEINPVTWYVLARHGVPILGGPTDRLDVYVDVADRQSWVVENVDTYWRSVADQLESVLRQEPEQEAFHADAVEWCVLGIARMLFTSTTGAVTSKSDAGRWAASEVPGHGELFVAAVGIRLRADPDELVVRSVIDATVDVVRELTERIRA